jgi:ubiquitin carboxyl-terminal hydrolase 7
MCFNILICYQIRLEKEREEKERRKKEKAEAHLYTIVKVFKSTS